MAEEKYACVDKDGNVLNVIVLDVEKEAELKPIFLKSHGWHDMIRYDHLPQEEHAGIGGKYDHQTKKFSRKEKETV